jgi:hypothetical protein
MLPVPEAAIMPHHPTREQFMNVNLVDLPRDDLREHVPRTVHIDSHTFAS